MYGFIYWYYPHPPVNAKHKKEECTIKKELKYKHRDIEFLIAHSKSHITVSISKGKEKLLKIKISNKKILTLTEVTVCLLLFLYLNYFS